MFELEDDAPMGKEKCFTSIGTLPPYVDPQHPPTKKSPFSTILGHPLIHKIQMILPQEVYNSVWTSMSEELTPLQYARAIFPLSTILEQEFLTKYIKIGNILLISEGRKGLDNVYSLRDGILSLELDKTSYEKAGLVGKPVPSGGRTHVKTRYVIEINLRSPSMLHGKKGFERLQWATRNVLNNSTAWLFYDLSEPSSLADTSSPIQKYRPQIITCSPTESQMSSVLVPPFCSSNTIQTRDNASLRDLCNETQEWLALAVLNSQLLRVENSIDPYLCRYAIPDLENCQPSNLVKISWHGFISSRWATQLFSLILRRCSLQTSNSRHWFAIFASALGKDAVDGKDGYTILAQPFENHSAEKILNASPATQKNLRRQYVCWEYVGSNILNY